MMRWPHTCYTTKNWVNSHYIVNIDEVYNIAVSSGLNGLKSLVFTSSWWQDFSPLEPKCLQQRELASSKPAPCNKGFRGCYWTTQMFPSLLLSPSIRDSPSSLSTAHQCKSGGFMPHPVRLHSCANIFFWANKLCLKTGRQCCTETDCNCSLFFISVLFRPPYNSIIQT